MRSPSARVMANACTIYPYAPVTDVHGGIDPALSYPTASATAVPCSAQQTAGQWDAQNVGGLAIENQWVLFLNADHGLKLYDKILVLDASGSPTNTLFVSSQADAAGRGATWEVQCVEKT